MTTYSGCYRDTVFHGVVQGGVALASAAELSFNWLGFLSAMASNLTFGFRAVWSKRLVWERRVGRGVCWRGVLNGGDQWHCMCKGIPLQLQPLAVATGNALFALASTSAQ